MIAIIQTSNVEAYPPVRRWMWLAVTLAVTAAALATPHPAVASGTTSCRATDLTAGTPPRSNLQRAIDLATAGDTIRISGVCIGTFAIDIDLALIGAATATKETPVLDAQEAGTVLTIAPSASVTLTHLVVTGGYARNAGNIVNEGALVLMDTVVRGSHKGGGIHNSGSLTLDGTSSVRRNAQGGIFNEATLTMNDTSSVVHNHSGMGIFNGAQAVLAMHDESSVRRNNFLGGIYGYGSVTMDGSATVAGNTGGIGGITIFSGGQLVMNGSSTVRDNIGPGINSSGTVTLDDASSVTGNAGWKGGGIYSFVSLTLNGSAQVTGNTASRSGGGIFVANGVATLNDSSEVSANASTRGGGGITNRGVLTLNGSSHITGNTALENGGGIANRFVGTVTMNGLSVVTSNRADLDHDGSGTGGGIYCRAGSLSGAIDGGNVDANFIGPTDATENNIVLVDC